MALPLLPFLSLLSLSLLLSLPFASSDSFDVYDSSQCSAPLSYPFLSTAISTPGLDDGCWPIDLPPSVISSSPLWTAWFRFSSVKLHPSGISTSFALYNDSCRPSSLLWTITATSPHDTITCTTATFTNHTTTHLLSSPMWISIDRSVSPPDPSDESDSITVSGAVIGLLVLIAVAVVALLVVVIWCCNRQPTPVRVAQEDWYSVLT